jgi:cytochrome bd-type quinol oxidase subunit 2
MPPMLKVLVAIAFVAILASLGSALFFMMRSGKDDKARGDNMARALAFRIGFSVLLFLCLLGAWKMGWIQPTGIPLSK